MSEQETLAMVPATITEVHDDVHGGSMTVAVDLSSLGVPDSWEYDSVLSVEDGEVVLLLFPPDP
jgi:hypothetical protein